MARIAVAGFIHETNSFAREATDFDAFTLRRDWPGLTRGPGLLAALAGHNLAATGFIDAAGAAGHTLVPLLWCSAAPGAAVTADAFERIAAMILDDLAAAGRIDAVYLDLHGAMVCEAHGDGEAELLGRLRAAVGPRVPVVASLDFHANVGAAMVAAATLLDAYRSYPHIDMAATGGRLARRMAEIIDGPAPFSALKKLPFLMPLVWQCTDAEPCRTIFNRRAALAAETGAELVFTPGFPLADSAACGPAVLAYAADQARADAAADALYDDIVGREGDFAGEILDADTAVRRAMNNTAPGPVVLADVQDNPGAGAGSDRTGLLAALVRHRAPAAIVAMIHDPAAAAQAHEAGQGAAIDLALGAEPYRATFHVEALGDGNVVGGGPMWRGSRMELGPMALLRVDAAPGVRVVVSSRKLQAGDRALLRHLGVVAEEQRILALKSMVHFRADFDAIAAATLIVAAPGPVPADTSSLPYRHLRPGLRLGPLGKPFTGR